ncbi:hypothetical protein H9P43_001344 [Blastocladiella emersonii ATCC 22665]|nr:hypothetical protein H9P43_001344 [Blastocladiella emersonii ATCC 22665]
MSSSTPPQPPPGSGLGSGASPPNVPAAPQCELMDGFAIGVQLLMGSAAFLSLLFKRHRESPRRPMRVWLCDVSKQGFGASFVHGLNVLVSLVAGANPESHSQNPCVYYFLNVGIDTTVGVYILFLWLRLAHGVVVRLGIERDLRSGHYGDPPRFLAWLKQTILFSFCLFMMKVCVALAIYLFPVLEWVGKIALAPFKDPRTEVLFVMLVFPMIMNIVQFWLVDHVIKHKGPLPPSAAGGENGTLDVFSPPSRRTSLDSYLFEDEYLSDTSLLTTSADLPHAGNPVGCGGTNTPPLPRPLSSGRRWLAKLAGNRAGYMPVGTSSSGSLADAAVAEHAATGRVSRGSLDHVAMTPTGSPLQAAAVLGFGSPVVDARVVDSAIVPSTNTDDADK